MPLYYNTRYFERRSRPLWLPGKFAAINLVLLISSALLASFTPLLFISIALDIIALELGIVAILMIAYLVFLTQGRGHYELTLWKIADAFLANILAQTAANYIVWKLGFVTSPPTTMFTHTTPAVSAVYALYDLYIYSALMITGGGIIDNQPVVEIARIIVALQDVWSQFAYIIVFSAAVATLTTHSDEPPPESELKSNE